MQPRKFKVTGSITENTIIFGTTVGKFSELISKEFEKQFALLRMARKRLDKSEGENTNKGKRP